MSTNSSTSSEMAPDHIPMAKRHSDARDNYGHTLAIIRSMTRCMASLNCAKTPPIDLDDPRGS
ncbi:hypothetical protein PROFUN_12786 [Planoprotostelium fungivorum]|uniref:Uncharacterized protein n=1 Tax=Planoprotostelium fungivorum TaxID=1890364 RepID=A0A2P6N6J1_9EUKA|nr:hypothetical protein PROFUN_12786 [Planoprotostelium fungivorum]